MTKSVLNFSDVAKTFYTPAGNVNALTSANISLTQGSFTIVTGPSGSGKSTLLNLASLLDKPTKGRASLLGHTLSDLTEKQLCKLRGEEIGMVFQSFHLMPSLSVLQNILFTFRYINSAKLDIKKLAERAAEKVGISHLLNQPARLLSGGEMQRVAIARAITNSPSLLVADEPTGNLDSANANRIVSLFSELNSAGTSILMVTHNRELLRYASAHYEAQDGYLQKTG